MAVLRTEVWKAYAAADDAWSAELAVLFGSRAGDVRYTARGHGVPGTKLGELYRAYVAARTAWYAERAEAHNRMMEGRANG